MSLCEGTSKNSVLDPMVTAALPSCFSSRNNCPVNVEGSAGLRIRFGVEPSALLADIRECERVCAEEEPDQALSFVEYVQPVSDADTKDLLDAELERLLAGTTSSFTSSAPEDRRR